MKTILDEATIEMTDRYVIVTKRVGGTPSSPQPSRSTHVPREGQTLKALYQEIVNEHINQDGE
jgi:hypothetical protein